MVKAIFFDIDGTLLSHKQGAVPDGTKRALRKLKEKGIKLFVATGRHLLEVQELPVKDLQFDGYVTLNGQLCLDEEKKLFFSAPIHQDDVREVITLFQEKKLPIMIIEKERMYINYIDDCVREAQKDISTSIPEIGIYDGGLVYQFVVYTNQRNTREMQALRHSKINDWNKNAFDILPASGGKMKGISEMLNRHHIAKEDIMAFGDGENDIDMLCYAGIGIAMGNAKPEVKCYADDVTESVDEEGILKALEKYDIL